MVMEEASLIALLKENPEAALKEMYNSYYTFLCYAVYKVLPDRTAAEDIVQEVFYEVWKKRESLNIITSLKAYLKRAAINRTLNYIRNKKINFEEEGLANKVADKNVSAEVELEAKELKMSIDEAIEGLPERCRLVFSMSRYEELSYSEIASSLNISIKTVENQISKALKILRTSLKEHIYRKK